MAYAGIYVHIPFCRAKCSYCDFDSYPGLDHLYTPYADALCREIAFRASAWRDVRFDTFFIGGGTPTMLSPTQIGRILEACRAVLNVVPPTEVTIEANPGTVTLASLSTLRVAGVNRLSLGVQSLHDDELALLGRIHNASQALDAYQMARSAGFANINLDLIFGLPGQSVARWHTTLSQALALAPEHLSLYALTLEPETALAERIAAGALPAPEDDHVADMYELAEALLEEAGYVHYEISNWARRTGDDRDKFKLPAFACQHNLKYWHNRAYLGLGAAAHSYGGQRRYANVRHPQEYIARILATDDAVVASEDTSLTQCMGETMMLGLRLLVGVTWEDFARRFGLGLRSVYSQEIDELVDQGLLEADAHGVRLTTRGHLLGNRVFAAFLREETC